MALKSKLAVKHNTKILRESHEIREVQPTKRSGLVGYIVLDLLTITLCVLLGFNLMPYKLHHVLTLLRSL